MWRASQSPSIRTATIIRLQLLLTLALYILVAVLVAVRTHSHIRRLRLSRRGRWLAIAEGAAIGAVAGSVAAAVNTRFFGTPSDPFLLAVVSEGTAFRAIIAALVAVACAPIVEEWLFRGVLTEALRELGNARAIALGALAFCLWHWTIAGAPYYFVFGVGLAVVYLKRGLGASIATHAAFSGVLLACALISVHGSARVIHAGGVSVRAPAAWRIVREAPTGKSVLSLVGPSGAQLTVTKRQEGSLSPTTLRALITDNGLAFLGVEPSVRSIHASIVSGGPALSMRATWDGVPARVVATVRGPFLWVVTADTAGSPRAAKDFNAIVKNLVLASGMSSYG